MGDQKLWDSVTHIPGTHPCSPVPPSGCCSSFLCRASAAHEELLTHPFWIFRGRWCLPAGLWDMLEPCSYFWHRLFLPLHLDILLLKSWLRSKPFLPELHCHKTSKPTPAQLFSSLMPQYNPQKSVRERRLVLNPGTYAGLGFLIKVRAVWQLIMGK